jgi:hypothetical protein
VTLQNLSLKTVQSRFSNFCNCNLQSVHGGQPDPQFHIFQVIFALACEHKTKDTEAQGTHMQQFLLHNVNDSASRDEKHNGPYILYRYNSERFTRQVM